MSRPALATKPAPPWKRRAIAAGAGCWYRTHIYECPVCLSREEHRERMTTPRPADAADRTEYYPVYDWCNQ